MRVILQRVRRAAVRVAGEVVGNIDHGFMLLVGFGADDTAAVVQPMAEKIVHMRVFSNDQGRFDKSLLDVHGAILAVPQFTLYADTAKGRRPEFFQAMAPPSAAPLFDLFVESLRSLKVNHVATGIFGAHMEVELINDGPVTISLER